MATPHIIKSVKAVLSARWHICRVEFLL